MKQKRFGMTIAAAMVACVGFGMPVFGQSTLDNPTGEYIAYTLDSGTFANTTDIEEIVFADMVQIDDGNWVRIFIDPIQSNIPEGSYVRLTSALDGEVQKMDFATLQMWDWGSAFFNGDMVFVELIAAPHTTGNRVVLERTMAELAPMGHTAELCGICGADDRVLSFENYAGRLMPVGCSGTVYTTDSCMVTAGHCMQSGLVFQFNVPLSYSNCNTKNPPVDDQFPVLNYEYVNGGVGNDWGAAAIGTNGLGEQPYDRYGEYRPIAADLANSGDIAEVWGYGIDEDDCTHSQVQQYHFGPIQTRYSDYYTYNIDITFGNSGSSMFLNDEIIGIVTHCSYGCSNYATRVDRSNFVAGREATCESASPCLTLSSGTLVSGESTWFSVEDGAAGEVVAVLYSFSDGSFIANDGDWCVDFGLDIPDPYSRIVVQGTLGIDGSFTDFRSIPGGSSGMTVKMQAAQAGTCPDPCMSEIMTKTIQ